MNEFWLIKKLFVVLWKADRGCNDWFGEEFDWFSGTVALGVKLLRSSSKVYGYCIANLVINSNMAMKYVGKMGA